MLYRYQNNGAVGFAVIGAELPNFLAELGIQVAASPSTEGNYEDVSLEVVRERLAVDWVITGNYGDELQASLLIDPASPPSRPIAEGRFVTFTAQQTVAGSPVAPPTIPVLLDALAPVLNA